MTTTSPPFLLPPLINPYVRPVASRSTPGLLHMVIRGDVAVGPMDVECDTCGASAPRPCDLSYDDEDAGWIPSTRAAWHATRIAAAERAPLVTRWYCTGTQRPHNGPHCKPGCVHIAAVKAQLEREEDRP